MNGPLILMGEAGAACEGGICDLPGPAAKAAPKPETDAQPEAQPDDTPAPDAGADAGEAASQG